MKHQLISIVLLATVAVTSVPAAARAAMQTANVEAADSICDFPEEPPTFKGGDKEADYQYMQLLKYPEEALVNNWQGEVEVMFVVASDGSVVSPVVIKSSGHDPLDKAAIAAALKMPKFIPASINGHPVPARRTQKAQFRIQQVMY